MGLTQRSAFVVFGLLGGIVTAAPAAADLLLVQDASFQVDSGLQILNNGVPTSDEHSQSGDQNNNPFNANVAAEASIPGQLTLNSSAQLGANWGASNIGAGGGADFTSSDQLSSGQFVSLSTNSTLSITFQVQTDATYELIGQISSSFNSSASSEMSLINFDTSAVLHDVTSEVPFSFSGTLSAGVNYQLEARANVFLDTYPGFLENLEAQFNFNMELTAVPAPGAFGLFLLSGIMGRPKRRR